MRKTRLTVDVILFILCIACAILGVALAIAQPYYLLPVLVLLIILCVVVLFNVRRIRHMVSKTMHASAFENSETQFSLTRLSLPVMAVSGKNIVWYNDAFLQDLLAGQDACLSPVAKIITGFDMARISAPGGQNLCVGERAYTVYGAGKQDGGLFVAYFVDNTVLKAEAEEYVQSRVCVMTIMVDTYDEILKELKESERARIAGEIDLALEKFIAKTSGFLRRTSASHYVAAIEERHMREVESAKFDLLDTVRAIGAENVTVTLSIGVGRGGDSMRESEEMSRQALDMALGRGGDQAVVRSKDGLEFYGGVSRSVEKRSKVKSRIVATALRDTMQQCDSVLIMGHKMSDLDSVGAAVGMLRFCKICNKPAAIVINEKRSLAANLIAQLVEAGYADDFVTPEKVVDDVSAKTLLVIVDTHLPNMLESNALYAACKNVVVIDHHRKCMGYIDNAIVFYHEPYASSASELVSELLQYIGEKEDKPTSLEAQALLAGIMLDTRSFSLHTGVRTFEAAAYLRRMGAQTQEVKKLFASSFEEYAFKSKLVSDAVLYKGCAIVIEEEMPEDMDVVVPQAANDLLTIEDVQASFVAVLTPEQVMVSARSMGSVNVQIIMEKLGGGGHLTMAGAQLKGYSLEQARTALYDAIDQYWDSQNKETK